MEERQRASSWIVKAGVFAVLACVAHANNMTNSELSTIIGDLRENPIIISSIPWQITNTSIGFPQNNTVTDFEKCLVDPFKIKEPTTKFVDVYFRYQPQARTPIKISLCSEFESAFLVIYDITESKQLDLEETAVYSCKSAQSNSKCTQSTKYRESMTTVLEMDVELSEKHAYVFGLIGFESVSQESQFSLNMKLNDSSSESSGSQPPLRHRSSATFRHDKGIVGGLVMASIIFVVGCIALGLSMRARYRINLNESTELIDQDMEEIMSPLSPSRVATVAESEMTWLSGSPSFSQ